MAFGKTPEQKAAEQAAREQREAAEGEERRRRAFLASPVGQATAAKEQGQGFLEIQLTVGSSQRDSTIWGDNVALPTKTASHAGTLAAIEAVGWRLEHVGYVFVVTDESSRDHVFASGQQVAVSGNTVGIYLFRSAD